MHNSESWQPALNIPLQEPAKTRVIVDPQRLNSLALTRLVAGVLPTDIPARLMAGAGQNGRCALCDQNILGTDVEYDVSVVHQGKPQSFLFHIACYHAWLRACRAHLRADAMPGS